MFESDADRLAMIKSLGGLAVSIRGQTLWAIFDNGNADVLTMMESSDPTLTCRTLDVVLNTISKDDTVMIGSEQYRIKKVDNDGTGMSRIPLKK